MGTDIHMYIERRQPDGSWLVQPPPAPPPACERTEKRKRLDNGEEYDWVNPFWGPHRCMHAYSEDCGPEHRLQWYSNRNYDVFAILTGTVRNGHGFSGVETSSGFNGIVAEPRGMPQDVSPVIREHHSWGHSPGWLTLDEILAFDWTQSARHVGVIPMLEAEKYEGDVSFEMWRKGPRVAPKSYCGGVSGPRTTTVDEVRAHLLLCAARFRQPDTKYYVQVWWSETYAQSADDFLAFVQEMLVPLGDPKDTRLVFGFDS